MYPDPLLTLRKNALGTISNLWGRSGDIDFLLSQRLFLVEPIDHVLWYLSLPLENHTTTATTVPTVVLGVFQHFFLTHSFGSLAFRCTMTVHPPALKPHCNLPLQDAPQNLTLEKWSLSRPTLPTRKSASQHHKKIQKNRHSRKTFPTYLHPLAPRPSQFLEPKTVWWASKKLEMIQLVICSIQRPPFFKAHIFTYQLPITWTDSSQLKVIATIIPSQFEAGAKKCRKP